MLDLPELASAGNKKRFMIQDHPVNEAFGPPSPDE